MNVWVTRHTMIAITYLMLAAEAYGFATAPMEGFDPDAVRREFEIPEEAEVVALVAIGRAKTPIKPYPGRLATEKIVHRERFGAGSASAGRARVEEVSASRGR
jgi:nitroreductase